MKTKIVSWLIGFVIGIGIGYYVDHKQSKDVTLPAVELSLMKAHVIDSMNDVATARQMKAIDSTLAVKSATSEHRKRYIAKQRTVVNDAVAEYRADSAAQSEKCDSALTAYYLLTDSLTAQVNDLESVRRLQSEKIVLLSAQVDSKNNVIDNANRNIDVMRRELARNNTWWNRNKKWFYVVGGAVAGAGTLHLINR